MNMDYDGEHDLLWGIAIVVITVVLTLGAIWLLDG
jgi:hypothetical protein